MKIKGLPAIIGLGFLLAFIMIFMVQCKEKGDLVWEATATNFGTVTVINRSFTFSNNNAPKGTLTIKVIFSDNVNGTVFKNAVSLKNIVTGTIETIDTANCTGTDCTVTDSVRAGDVYRLTINASVLESVSGDHLKKDYKYTFKATP